MLGIFNGEENQEEEISVYGPLDRNLMNLQELSDFLTERSSGVLDQD